MLNGEPKPEILFCFGLRIIQSEQFSEAIMQERRKFQSLIESATQNKQCFSLKYNTPVIEGATYFMMIHLAL